MENSILIVEDDKDIRKSLEIFLKMKGFNASSTDDLVIEKLTPLPNLILMDVFLSGKSGKDLCRAIKNNSATAHIPVIMMSATPSARTSCLKAGANNFISKPFQLSEMMDTIEKLLTEKKNLQNL